MTRIPINEWPPNAPPDLAKKENVLVVARLMANAALTAPVSGGVPSWEAEIAHGEKEIELIAREMGVIVTNEFGRYNGLHPGFKGAFFVFVYNSGALLNA